jgi:hypothetical protein
MDQSTEVEKVQKKKDKIYNLIALYSQIDAVQVM